MPLWRDAPLGLTRGKMTFVAILLALASYATWPGDDSLDYRSCEPKSSLSQLSAAIYGRFFWEQALAGTRYLAADTEKLDQTWINMSDTAKSQKEKNDREIEEIYAKYPKMEPTAAERSAQRLRDQADQIEGQEGLNQFLSTDRKVIADARRCEQVIVAKLQTM